MKRRKLTSILFLVTALFSLNAIGFSQYGIQGPDRSCDDDQAYYSLTYPSTYNDSCEFFSVQWNITQGDGFISSSSNSGCTVIWNYATNGTQGKLEAVVTYNCDAGAEPQYIYNHTTHIVGLGTLYGISGNSTIMPGDVSEIYSVPDLAPETSSEVYTWTVSQGVAWALYQGDPKKIIITGTVCDDFDIHVVVTRNQYGCIEQQSDDLEVNVNASLLSQSHFEESKLGLQNMCVYPNGTYQGTFSVEDNPCVTYYWYTQTHMAPPDATKGSESGSIPLGEKRLTIIGSNSGSSAEVRAIKSGDSKVYCRITTDAGIVLISFDVSICADTPDAPYPISGPQTMEIHDEEQYSYPSVSCSWRYHRWTSDPQGLKINGGAWNTDLTVDVQAKKVGTYYLYVAGDNACGEGDPSSIQITVTSGGPKSELLGDRILHSDETGIKIYPNPAYQTVNIESAGNTNIFEIQIFSLQGAVLQKKKISAGNSGINVAELNPGIYFIKVLSDGFQHQEKLIIID